MITNIVFAGVRGGVGTTTLTALSAALFHQAGAVVSLADHSEGRLDSRLATYRGALGVTMKSLQLGFAPQHQGTISLSLLDAGTLHQPVVRYLHSPTTGLVLVGSPDSESAAAITAATELITAEVGAAATSRCCPCIIDVRNQERKGLTWHRLTRRNAATAVPDAARLPFEPNLQPWGPIPVEQLAQRQSRLLPPAAALLDSVLTARVGPVSAAAPTQGDEPEESTGTVWLTDQPAGQVRY